jgi:hypothetical protein
MKTKQFTLLSILTLTLVLVLSGCAGLGMEEPTSTPAPTQAEGEEGVWTKEEVVEAVKADLAERLEIDQAEISVVSAESRDWEDASLGCPEEGEMYAQVITHGFQIILEANGTEYDYRTDDLGSFKLCEQ